LGRPVAPHRSQLYVFSSDSDAADDPELPGLDVGLICAMVGLAAAAVSPTDAGGGGGRTGSETMCGPPPMITEGGGPPAGPPLMTRLPGVVSTLGMGCEVMTTLLGTLLGATEGGPLGPRTTGPVGAGRVITTLPFGLAGTTLTTGGGGGEAWLNFRVGKGELRGILGGVTRGAMGTEPPDPPGPVVGGGACLWCSIKLWICRDFMS